MPFDSQPKTPPPQVAHDACVNANVDPVFTDLEQLRAAMTRSNPGGAAFLDYLLDGDYFAGKGVWVNDEAATRGAYETLLAAHPYLASENPYGAHFRRDRVRQRGDNVIAIRHVCDLDADDRALLAQHAARRDAGDIKPVALFAGGPAAKIGAILTLMHAQRPLDVRFLIDGAEQSNESGSASYEHINHANALNDETDNTGLGILNTAVKRALMGEDDPSVALETGYARVDLWPRGIKLRDVPIYAYNEVHGWVQRARRKLGLPTEHDKSRIASRLSTDLLTHIEQQTGVPLRLEDNDLRPIHIYFTERQHKDSLHDNAILEDTVGLTPRKLSRAEIAELFGQSTANNITSADVFPENSCLRHGFDQITRQIMEQLGGSYRERVRILEIVIDPEAAGGSRAMGVITEDILTGARTLIPADYLSLTLGPTAQYGYAGAAQGLDVWRDALGATDPLPRQTIATGATMQVLFRITDREAFRKLPHTDLKQTHFVEIAEQGDWLLVKLTAGGNIGLPVYSRSYAISALASMFRVLTPDCGLTFETVVSAWPCSRGINGPNNGQVVRFANNAAVRFGEGGTGMSKMGTNAQTLMDMVGIAHSVPKPLRMDDSLWRHTLIDHRARIAGRVARARTGLPVCAPIPAYDAAGVAARA